MNRFRTLLSALLGLVLLAQGFAVAAAPRAKLSKGEPASVSVMADMPCHAPKVTEQDGSAKKTPVCCDANCPDMTTCALSHLGFAMVVSVSLPLPSTTQFRFTPALTASPTPGSPLRPPIVLHG
jgi:hypothetical protein